MVAPRSGNDAFTNLCRSRPLARTAQVFAGRTTTAPPISSENIELSDYRIRSVVREELAAAQSEIIELRAALKNALARLGVLETANSNRSLVDLHPSSICEERQLVQADSEEMQGGLRLCAELFPGSNTEVEVDCDPSEPQWKWYTFNVRWAGEIRDSIDRQMEWHNLLAQAYPQLSDQFRMIVDLQ